MEIEFELLNRSGSLRICSMKRPAASEHFRATNATLVNSICCDSPRLWLAKQKSTNSNSTSKSGSAAACAASSDFSRSSRTACHRPLALRYDIVCALTTFSENLRARSFLDALF